jgi:hypothetical protein
LSKPVGASVESGADAVSRRPRTHNKIKSRMTYPLL